MAFKMKGFSPFTKRIDPDAPGTPGTPGYEPPVKRSDLDEKGKKIWDSKHKTKVPLSKHEKKKGTIVTGGNKSEEMNDLEDRIEFLNSDISDESSVMKKGKMVSQLNKLKAQLKKLRSN